MDEPETRTTVFVHDDEKEEEKWDCESVLTTYSNIYNHPKLIATRPSTRIRLSKKTGLPLVDNPRPIVDVVEEPEDRPNITFERKKDETSEERRARKHAVKDIRRVRSPSLEILTHRPFVLGSSSDQESDEGRLQTRRTETTARTSSAHHSSASAESSCRLIRCFFRSALKRRNRKKGKFSLRSRCRRRSLTRSKRVRPKHLPTKSPERADWENRRRRSSAINTSRTSSRPISMISRRATERNNRP